MKRVHLPIDISFNEKKIEEIAEKVSLVKNPNIKAMLSPRAKQELENILHRVEHDVKFLVDVWSQISRSSLSIGGTGLLEILKNKYEITYPVAQPAQTVNDSQRRT